MGIDATLFLSNKWSISNIQDILKTHLSIETQKVEFHTWAPEYMTICFEFKKENRMLHVHLNSERGGFNGMLLSFRAWGASVRRNSTKYS